MNVESTQKEVETKEGELAKLLDEKKVIMEKKDAISAVRAKALKALASGDSTQKKIVSDCERDLLPLDHQAEGLTLLTEELQAELTKGKAALKEATEADQKALNEFIKGKEQEHLKSLRDSLPELQKEIIDLFIKLSMRLCEFQVIGVRDAVASDLLSNLPLKIQDELKAQGYGRLLTTGYAMPIVAWPVVSPDLGFPGEVINVNELAKHLSDSRVAKWTDEFRLKSTRREIEDDKQK